MQRILRVLALFLFIIVMPSALATEAPGRRILATDNTKSRIAIIAADGTIEWEWKVQAIHDLHRLPNGNILFQTSFQHTLEVDPKTNKVVWEYDSGKNNGNAGRRVEVHAIQRLRNGDTMIAESGPARIIEVDKNGVIKKEIKLKVNNPDAHSDTRLVRKLNNGNYLVAQERDGAIREYDSKGSVVWEYDIPLFDKPRAGGHGVEAFGNQAFCALRLRNGNTLIATGNGHSILEVTPAKQIVWSLHQKDLPGITLAWVTTLQVLPNGNIILGNCHAGQENPQVIEITRDKKVVWQWKDFNLFGNSLTNTEVLDVRRSIR